MRLWSLHPRYLDPRGLVALWREALLAQKVLRGETRGYRHHPQLARFRDTGDTLGAIAAYLAAIHAEACSRGYRFDAHKIGPVSYTATIPLTDGQLLFEWRHLRRKLKARCPALLRAHRGITLPDPHPIFTITAGPIAPWERIS